HYVDGGGGYRRRDMRRTGRQRGIGTTNRVGAKSSARVPTRAPVAMGCDGEATARCVAELTAHGRRGGRRQLLGEEPFEVLPPDLRRDGAPDLLQGLHVLDRVEPAHLVGLDVVQTERVEPLPRELGVVPPVGGQVRVAYPPRALQRPP